MAKDDCGSDHHDSPVALSYRPVTAASYKPAWVPCLAFAFLNVLFTAGLYFFGHTSLNWVGVSLIPGCVAAALMVRLWGRGDAWQYRVEGSSLAFRRPNDQGWAAVELGQVCTLVRTWDEDTHVYELVFHSGQRVLLRGPLFEPWRRFQASIGEVAPGIRFEHRHLGFCHRCGRAVSSIQRRCAHCGATAPTTLPTLEADVMLPDALRGGDADD